MKTIQLLELSHEPNFPLELEERIVLHYENSISSNDNYFRYYPDYPIEGLNEWLVDNGLYIDKENKFFYILIRIDW